MNLETYIILTLVSIFLNIANILIALILTKETQLKEGFVLIILGIVINSAIQLTDFFTKVNNQVIVINSFEIISFIGSIILFLVLTVFLVTKKLETKPSSSEEVLFYRPVYNFQKAEIPEEKVVSKPKDESGNTFKAVKSPETKITQGERIIVTEKPSAKPSFEEKVDTKEHVKEIPSNGKAVVAKFIKLEEPKSEIEKLKEELDKLKFQRDKLVSIISHDLRTPLTSVFGYCQLLKEGQYKNRNEVKQFAENIFELSKQQLNALNKIIEWTKYESPNLTLNPTEFDVTSTINFVAKSMSKIAEEKNIKIIVNSKPDLYVYGDEFMIIEVLKNLLDNAIKFSHPNSSIEIHTHYHEKINKLVVLVVDSGIGIDREILMNLLVSTKKFTTRGTRGEKGLGLGLLIVKAIIDKHGEHFWIASEEGKWTRVYFTLKPAKVISES